MQTGRGRRVLTRAAVTIVALLLVGCGGGRTASSSLAVPSVSLPPVGRATPPPATGACALIGDGDAAALAGRPLQRQTSSEALCVYGTTASSVGVASLTLRLLRLSSAQVARATLQDYAGAQARLPGAASPSPLSGIGDSADSVSRSGAGGDELQVAAAIGSDVLVVIVDYSPGTSSHADVDARAQDLTSTLLRRIPPGAPATPTAAPGY